MQQAAFLLRSTDMPVSEVGNAVGYDNLSYFHKDIQKAVCYVSKEIQKQFNIMQIRTLFHKWVSFLYTKFVYDVVNETVSKIVWGYKTMTEYYLGIDIGASSGRHILAHMEDGRMVLEEIHRFPEWYEPQGWRAVLGHRGIISRN